MARKKTPVKDSATRKPATKKSIARKQATKKLTDTTEFPAVFARLKAILEPYAPRMTVVKDDVIWYHLDTKFIGKNKSPKWVADMSPGLKKRMQGKACFNFTTVDDELFAELEALTKAGAKWFLSGGLEKILKMQ
jgi:hypothetical protein